MIVRESYPSEFTSHHIPLMFVAGLSQPQPPPQQQQQQQQSASVSQPPPIPISSSSGPALAPTDDDPFAGLISSLRKTLAPAKRGFHFWDNSRGVNYDFHVVLVDKAARFPPLKARPPPPVPGQPPPPLHSPISPLSPSSPLYPDGIIAPIWIKKHREMVPSVFLLVLRLGEGSTAFAFTAPAGVALPGPGGDSLAPAAGSQQATLSGSAPSSPTLGDEDRQRDGELIREIVDRKRSTLERGVKLAVVLLCPRHLLDDPALDLRLSLIRRASGLDSRASLFVVSPVPEPEVRNFVQSLRAELWPAAVDFYREHGRRVRRKRARQPPKGRLSDKGWAVRYDYKLAVFSEMRGEVEVALKHYEDAYETLLDMFGPAGLLPPRTKRWAEAKVLADCLTVKVGKLYLYLNEPARALNQLNRHLSSFRELSNVWNIGEQTFEFWSWLSKQYRLFAELVAIALRAGMRLPSSRPPPAKVPITQEALQAGINPSLLLQHPGYYFHLAGLCAVIRRDRYRALAASQPPPPPPPADGSALPAAPAASAAMQHEAKVDHADIAIDLFTKAYEHFKAHKHKNMTLLLAAQIALAHFEGGNHQMALKFHERIAKTYRRDQWTPVLDSIVRMSYISALHADDPENAIRLLLELLAPGTKVAEGDRREYSQALRNILRTKVPAEGASSTITVDMSQVAPLFECRTVFWHATSDVAQAVPFQLSITAPAYGVDEDTPFTSVTINFNDGRPPIVVSHDGSGSQGGMTEHCLLDELGVAGAATVEGVTANLIWFAGQTKVFSGLVSSSEERELAIGSISLTGSVGAWELVLNHVPDTSAAAATKSVWHLAKATTGPTTIPVSRSTPWLCQVRPRELAVRVGTEFAGPAYLDELFAVSVDVTNEDRVEVEVFLDLLLQPGEDDMFNQLHIDGQTSTSLVKAVSLGTLAPSATVRKTFRLLCTGRPGDRSLDLSVRCQPLTGLSTSASAPAEVLRTLAIPAVAPFHAGFETRFLRKRRAVQALLDLAEPDGWEGASEVTVVGTVECVGPWDVRVKGIELVCEEGGGVRLVATSLEPIGEAEGMSWRAGDRYNALFQLEVLPAVSRYQEEEPFGGVELVVSWRRKGDELPAASRTRLVLPPLRPVLLEPSITIALPPTMALHEPALLTYKLANPTAQLIHLQLQVEHSGDSFVFSGGRSERVLLAPHEERAWRMQVVPMAAGECRIPRLRGWVVERGQEGAGGQGREVVVAEEGETIVRKDLVQLGLEGELRSARGGVEGEAEAEAEIEGEGGGGELRVLVLPR